MPHDFEKSNHAPITPGTRQCRTCKFWEFYDERTHDEHGSCHRHAPHPTVHETEKETDALRYADWPLTRWNTWCGEWVHCDPEELPEVTTK